jgi:hypothetical protein
MNRLCSLISAVLITGCLFSSAVAQDANAKKKTGISKSVKSPATSVKKDTPAKTNGDTLVVVARIVEIPGKFAPNDLYNYVYIMKYRIVKVEKGEYKEQDILVGQYNPLIPRTQIKDAMKKCVTGNVEKFEVGAKQKLTLIKPIEKVWKDAVEDEYSDSDQDKYFAIRSELVK